jgi:uncharacterized protein YqcC (DUF446 family)
VDRYQRAAAFAGRIGQELRQLRVWQSEPMREAAYASDKAFFADTMTLFQWLQFVLVPRIQEIVAERAGFPAESNVGAYAVRELDGFDEAHHLILALSEFDEFVEDIQRGRSKQSKPLA